MNDKPETVADVGEVVAIPPTITREEAQTCQQWAGMDGAVAFHLIERHAVNWADVGLMMDAWLEANRIERALLAQPVGDFTPTDEMFAAWCETHDMQPADREAFEDAATLYLTHATPQPANTGDPGCKPRIVAWSRTGAIRDANGYPIGSDETEVKWQAEHPGGDGWAPLYDGPQPEPKPAAVEYDRDQIAEMLLHPSRFEANAKAEQASLLLAADNAEASGGRTVRREAGAVEVAMALDYSRNFAAANPGLSNTTREHILGLCMLLERVAGSRPAVEVTDAMLERAVLAYEGHAAEQGYFYPGGIDREQVRAALTAALQEGADHEA